MSFAGGARTSDVLRAASPAGATSPVPGAPGASLRASSGAGGDARHANNFRFGRPLGAVSERRNNEGPPDTGPAAYYRGDAAAADAAANNRTKRMGRRKQNRWNNAHFAGAYAHSRLARAAMAAGEMDPHDVASLDVESMRLRASYKSNLEGLQDHPALLDAFRRGAPAGPLAEAPEAVERRFASEMERMFARTDKRVRPYLLGEASPERGGIETSLLLHLERLLLYFMETGDVPPAASIPERLTSLMKCAPSVRVDTRKGGARFEPVLELEWSEAVHRLLTHGVCQFYVLRSKSATVRETAATEARRVMRIRLPKGAPPPGRRGAASDGGGAAAARSGGGGAAAMAGGDADGDADAAESAAGEQLPLLSLYVAQCTDTAPAAADGAAHAGGSDVRGAGSGSGGVVASSASCASDAAADSMTGRDEWVLVESPA